MGDAMTAGTAPTPTEPPAPWTPPAHWPPMPEGLTPAQVADWIARLTQADANKAQAEAMNAAAVEQRRATQAVADGLAAMAGGSQMSERDLVLHFLARMPEMTGLSDLDVVDLAIKRVNALRRRFPPA
jgi:hypothetical protein